MKGNHCVGSIGTDSQLTKFFILRPLVIGRNIVIVIYIVDVEINLVVGNPVDFIEERLFANRFCKCCGNIVSISSSSIFGLVRDLDGTEVIGGQPIKDVFNILCCLFGANTTSSLKNFKFWLLRPK